MTLLSLARGRLAGVGAVLALALAAACSEKLDGGIGCTRDQATLCPVSNADVVDTTLDPVVLDTALAGVPVPGDAPTLLLALRPGADSLDVRAVVRFDSVPARFSPPAGGDSVAISTVDSTAIRLSLDTTGTRFTGPVTIEAYDVDTASIADTASAVLAGLFRPDRLLGSATLATQTVTGDTVSIPLSNEVFAARAQGGGRFRVGLRLVSTATARVRFFGVGLSGATGSSAPVVRFDPSSDTTYRPIQVYAYSKTPSGALASAYRDQTVVARTPQVAEGSDLVVGGLPSRRTYLRFAVPARFTDSVDVVRASLILTQRPGAGRDAIDTTVTIQPLAVLATDAVTDLLRASELSTSAVGLATVSLSPMGSGVHEFQVVNLVRSWRALASNVPRALVLRASNEGAQAAELRFYSTEAPDGLRPRLRLTYVPRSNFGLP